MPFVSSLTKSLVFALSILSLSTSLFAATYGDLIYEVVWDSITITGCYQSASGDLIIPALIDEKPVTTIGDSAFRDCSSLTSVTIPSSVTYIESPAFIRCYNLTNINVDSTNPYFSSVGGILFNKSQTTLIKCPATITGSYTIPNSVTTIETIAFERCYSLTKVTIPESVTVIEEGAFFFCSNLTNVTVPRNVTTIGTYAFRDCSSLSSVTFNGDAPASLDYFIFRDTAADFTVYFYNGATGFTEPTWEGYPSVMLPAFLTYEINGDSVTITNCDSNFSGDLSIPAEIDGMPVTTIADSAFRDCSSLTSVRIPDRVTSIGDLAFDGCSSLTRVTFNGDAPASLGSSIFDNTAIDFAVNYYTGAIGFTATTWEGYPSVMLPAELYDLYYLDYEIVTIRGVSDRVTITDCNSSVFGGVSIPALIEGMPVTTIADSAFRDCSSLTSVTIPDSVTYIESYAFSGCSSLTSFDVDPANLYFSSFDGVLFNKLQAKIVQYPGGRIGSYTIPDSVTYIGAQAFHSCSSLTSVTIPDSVTTIGYEAFHSCSSLTSVDVDLANLYFSSIDGILFNKLQTTILQYPEGRIGSYTIPDSVTTIGAQAFRDCSSLTSVTIPDSVTTIGHYAFRDCSSLTSVTIPDSVTTIGHSAFRDCSSLTSVTFNGDAPASLSSFVFHDTAADFTVYFYKGATGFTEPTWEGDPSVMLPAELYYLDYEIGGSGSVTITDCNSSFSGEFSIPALIDGKPVTTIADSAFHDCSNLTSVTIPDSVTSIGDAAFRGCSSLTSATFNGNAPELLAERGELFTFDNTAADFTVYFYESSIGFTEPTWEGYPSVMLPAVLYYLYYEINDGSVTITDCRSDASGELIIPARIEGKSVTTIGSSAFRDCSSLTSVTIPDSVTTIGGYAFYGCSSLTSVTIPDSVTTIGAFAFSYCSSLTNVTIPDSVTTIGSYTFYLCSSLTSVTIPDSVTTIGDSAFRGCSSLASVTFNGDAPTSLSLDAFNSTTDFTVYFYEDATGFSTPTWEGEASVELSLTSDEDGDKWPNNLERLLGTSPLDGNTRLKTWLSQGETGLKIHHAPYSESCEFVVESTSDLSDPESWLPVEGVSFTGDTSMQTADLSPTNEPAVFYRISVNEIE